MEKNLIKLSVEEMNSVLLMKLYLSTLVGHFYKAAMCILQDATTEKVDVVDPCSGENFSLVYTCEEGKPLFSLTVKKKVVVGYELNRFYNVDPYFNWDDIKTKMEIALFPDSVDIDYID